MILIAIPAEWRIVPKQKREHAQQAVLVDIEDGMANPHSGADFCTCCDPTPIEKYSPLKLRVVAEKKP